MAFCSRSRRIRRVLSITSHDAHDGVTTECLDDPERIGSSGNGFARELYQRYGISRATFFWILGERRA